MKQSGRHRPRGPAQPLRVLYEDNHLLGVFKAGGVLVQGDRTGDVTLLDLCKAYLKKKYRKPGNVFLGLVHRLDRPVSGVVLYARTSKAASRLANEFRQRRVTKRYLAVVIGRPRPAEGELSAVIERAHLRSRIAQGQTPGGRGKAAVLTYRVLERRGGLSLLEVTPTTGRHHQIRVQLAHAGHPIVGDIKYGAGEALSDKTIALHAASLTVRHPTLERSVTIAAPPPPTAPWTDFEATIETHAE